MTALPPVISQVGYPGAGDVDDCWAVTSIWAASAADPSIRKPTVPEFRAAAHNPDRPGPTGGNLSQIVHASAALWPDLPVSAYSSTDWAGFAADVRAGAVASLAVLSSALPAGLRFRFLGPHQVGVIWANGAFYVMNPLARNGAAPLPISELNLKAAARAVANGVVMAALYEPVARSGMAIYVQTDRTGSFVIKAKRTVHGYLPSPDGSGWTVVRKWNPKPADSSARFDAHLARLSGTTTPSGLLHVATGFFADTFVDTAEVVETFDPAPSVTS